MKFLGNINRNFFSIKNNISTSCERPHVQVAKDPMYSCERPTPYVYIYKKIIHFTSKNVDFFENFEKVKLIEKHSRTTPIQKKLFSDILHVNRVYTHFCSESSDQFLVVKIHH